MSKEYIFDCAKQFESLHSSMNEKLNYMRGKSQIKDDLIQVKGHLSELE